MKNHLGQWSKDYSFAIVNCEKQGHGKSTSPDNLITNRDIFFYLSAKGEETCFYCLKNAIAKTPNRYNRAIRMCKNGATLDEVLAETERQKLLKLK